jgi:hypothetical protein
MPQQKRVWKRRVLKVLLWLCLLISGLAIVYQIYEGRGDVPADIFGIAGVLAAISALYVTEDTLENLNDQLAGTLNDIRGSVNGLSGTVGDIRTAVGGIQDASASLGQTLTDIQGSERTLLGAVEEITAQTARLHDEITNIEDATRRNLDNFADIFARAVWLLKQARDEVWYVNFLFGFGAPHLCNKGIGKKYAEMARVLKINPDFEQAVKEFSALLLRKVQEIPRFNAIVLELGNLEQLFLERLRAKGDWGNLDVQGAKQKEEELRGGINTAIQQRKFHGIRPEDFMLKEIPRLPLQMLIARIPTQDGSGTKWGCLVFLVGTENVGGRTPRGFYTELDPLAGVYIDLAQGFIPDQNEQAAVSLSGSSLSQLTGPPPASNGGSAEEPQEDELRSK